MYTHRHAYLINVYTQALSRLCYASIFKNTFIYNLLDNAMRWEQVGQKVSLYWSSRIFKLGLVSGPLSLADPFHG